MKDAKIIVMVLVTSALCGYSSDVAFRKLEKSADAVVAGKIVLVEENGELVQVEKGVWMIKTKCHFRVAEGQRDALEKTVVIERFRNIMPTDRHLFDDDRSYLMSMVNQPNQAELRKGDSWKAVLTKSAANGLWRPASGFLNDKDSFIRLAPSA